MKYKKMSFSYDFLNLIFRSKGYTVNNSVGYYFI